MKRRSFIKALLVPTLALSSGLASFIWSFSASKGQHHAELMTPSLLKMLPETLRQQCVHYIKTLDVPDALRTKPNFNEAQSEQIIRHFFTELVSSEAEPFQARVEQIRQQDFEADRIVFLDGWILSYSEYALILLSGHQDAL